MHCCSATQNWQMPRGRKPVRLVDAIMTYISYLRNVGRCRLCGRSVSPSRGGTLCEKHYMRLHRHGYDKQPESGRACYSSGGYVVEYYPQHAIANKNGTIYQHRRVYYDVHGDGPFACHWCGCVVTWKTLHVDHFNNNKTDNAPNNLLAACEPCNHMRGHAIKFLNLVYANRLVEIAGLPLEIGFCTS